MSDSVAAAIGGDANKAGAFWNGLRLLSVYVPWKDLSGFVSNSIAARLKNGEVNDIIAVIQRLGAAWSKTVLKNSPLLPVLDKLVWYMDTVTADRSDRKSQSTEAATVLRPGQYASLVASPRC